MACNRRTLGKVRVTSVWCLFNALVAFGGACADGAHGTDDPSKETSSTGGAPFAGGGDQGDRDDAGRTDVASNRDGGTPVDAQVPTDAQGPIPQGDGSLDSAMDTDAATDAAIADAGDAAMTDCVDGKVVHFVYFVEADRVYRNRSAQDHWR